MAATGAVPTRHARDGDAILDGVAVEVKRADGGSLNQVRAAKYLTVVFICGSTWYVTPAHEIVRFVARHRRGQHTENPFESCALNVSDLVEFRIPSEGDLLVATRDAIWQSDRFVALKQAMGRIVHECKVLALNHHELVATALAQPPQDVPRRTFQARTLFEAS